MAFFLIDGSASYKLSAVNDMHFHDMALRNQPRKKHYPKKIIDDIMGISAYLDDTFPSWSEPIPFNVVLGSLTYWNHESSQRKTNEGVVSLQF